MDQNNKEMDTDFFGAIDPRDAHPTAPGAPLSYVEKDEEKAADEQLQRIIESVDEMSNELDGKAEDYGELPFDEIEDRKRWEQLEAEFTELLDREAKLERSKND